MFTALSPNGAGFITGRLSKAWWKFFLFLNRNTGSHKVLEFAGPIITGILLINWLLLIWTACTVMIYSDEQSVMNMETNTPAGLVSKIYFTGYTLSTMGIAHAQNHSAYPILHFYHTSDKKESFVLTITNLDEAITIMLLHLPEAQRPSNAETYPLRKAISNYLITINTAFINPAKEVPEIPMLPNFDKFRIPYSQEQSQITAHYDQLQDRRKALLGLIQDDGWQWEDLDAGSYDKTFSY